VDKDVIWEENQELVNPGIGNLKEKEIAQKQISAPEHV
jgi:hypothetical protein